MGIELDSVFVCGPEITFFYSRYRVTLFLCGSSKLTWFSYAAKTQFVLVGASKFPLVMFGGAKLT